MQDVTEVVIDHW